MDDLWFSGPARSAEELAWAERRLAELGFRAQVEGRTKAYTESGDDYVVYADPRERGKILFRVYRRGKRPGRRGHIVWEQSYRQFDIQDAWKHDLRGKFEARLAGALS